jgi:TolB protein
VILRLLSPLFALSLLVAASPAQAQTAANTRTVIEVGSPDFRPYPIAVPEARDMAGGKTTATGTEVTNTLRFDFELAATFKVLDPKSYLADPAKEGLAAASIKFTDWVSIGAEGLVKVGLTETGDSLKADFRFYDVASGRQLLQKGYAGTLKDGRRFAHTFVDEVIFFLTGSKGIFRTKIASVRKVGNSRELWVMDVDGSNLRQITSNGSINLLPNWTRDGGGVLFTSYIRHNPNLYSTPLAGGRPTLVSGERGLNTGGTMSPDGKKVALTLSRDGNSEIYTMNPDGTNLVRLTNEWAIDTSPTWSPDSKRIAFVSSRWGDPHIFVMNADGSNVRRVTERGNYNQTPDWSPKGDLIAFTARDERNVFDIFTVNPDTKEIKRLTQDQGNNEEPSFAPSGGHIVFTTTRDGGRSQVYIMAVDGSNQKKITDAGGFNTPAWSPYLE